MNIPFLWLRPSPADMPCRLAVVSVRHILLSCTKQLSSSHLLLYGPCTTFHRYPIFSKRYSVLCKVYTGYCGTSEIENGLCACTVDNPLATARGLSLRTGAQSMLYLSLVITFIRFPVFLSPFLFQTTSSSDHYDDGADM